MAHYLQEELFERVRADPALFAFLERGCLDGLWFWDLQNPEQEWLSPRFKAFFGFEEHEMADSPEWWQANINPEDLARAGAQVERCLADPDAPFDMVMRYRHRDGSAVWVRCRGLILRDADGRPVRMLGAHTDVTAIKRHELELSAANAELDTALAEAKAANAAKSHFLAKMSHEIRTPMNGVLGMADLLARTPLNAEQTRMLEAIRRSGTLLMATLNDILDVSKIEAGALTLETAPFSADDLAAQVEALHLGKAAETDTAFSVDVTGDRRWRIGDQYRLAQVLNNLVGNAMKFAAGERVAVSLDVADPAGMAIVVQDEGVGMTPEAVARIFEGYAQADASITRRFGGTGLGLSIVKALVDAMGGTVAVESVPGQGTRFALTLPLPATSRPASAMPRIVSPADGAVDGLNVLACDDNEINRMVLEGMLARLPVRFRVVDSGDALLAAAAEGAWDIALIDIVMPGRDGVQTLRALREAARPAPVMVACTAHAMRQQVEEYLAAGFDGHLAKPFDHEALVNALRTGTAGRRAAPAMTTA